MLGKALRQACVYQVTVRGFSDPATGAIYNVDTVINVHDECAGWTARCGWSVACFARVAQAPHGPDAHPSRQPPHGLLRARRAAWPCQACRRPCCAQDQDKKPVAQRRIRPALIPAGHRRCGERVPRSRRKPKRSTTTRLHRSRPATAQAPSTPRHRTSDGTTPPAIQHALWCHLQRHGQRWRDHRGHGEHSRR